jgi:hypothetical protein
MWVDFQSARRFQPVRSEAGLNAPRRLKACPAAQPRPSLLSSLGMNGSPVRERPVLTTSGPVALGTRRPGHKASPLAMESGVPEHIDMIDELIDR